MLTFETRRLAWVSTVFAGIVLFTTCGLDAYYYLDEPLNDGHTAFYTSTDFVQNYFSFITNEQSGENAQYFNSAAEFIFLGTEVYYKIYNNYSTMVSVESAIATLSESSNSSSAAENLIDSRGYKALKLSYGSRTPLVPSGTSPQNRYVYIRLNANKDEGPEYREAICIGEKKMTSFTEEAALTLEGTVVVPRRSLGANYGFTFKTGDAQNPPPQSGDEDVTYSSTASESGVWYVDMYAISVGRDNTYTTSYSRPFFLGSVAITESD